MNREGKQLSALRERDVTHGSPNRKMISVITMSVCTLAYMLTTNGDIRGKGGREGSWGRG